MLIADYYSVLGLHSGCTLEDIKKAYRCKAREYHPDLNHSPEAKDMFIGVTEAYEFLITYFDKMNSNEEEYHKAMEQWRKYRMTRARCRARVYARTSYSRFKNTSFYKTTRIFDLTTLAVSFAISLLVLIMSVYGYIYRIHHPIPGIENPTVFGLIFFILLGLVLFIISVVNLKIYSQNIRKHRNIYEANNQSI
jgi:hypothetical protein